MRFKFQLLLRDDVERVGIEGAYVLALIRYITALSGEYNGRFESGGHLWWQASYVDIAESLGGMTARKAGNLVRELESKDALLSYRVNAFQGDQTKAYRVPLTSNIPNLDGADQQNPNSVVPPSKIGMTPIQNRYDPHPKSVRSIPSTEELEEVKEELKEEGSFSSSAIAAPNAPPPPNSNGEVVFIDKISRNGGCGGNGRLSGICATTSNGTNSQVPARVVPGTDLVVADMDDPDAPYLRLGFVPSVSEPTLYGVAPPSRYCAKHQPSGTEGNCWGCGSARIYRDKTWPSTPGGFEYGTYQAAAVELAKQQGRPLAREMKAQALIEKLSSSPDAAMFGFKPDSFNPDSAVDRKQADRQSLKERPGEAAS
jgi:hypothetical protein